MTDVDGILASITQRETWAQEAYGANLEQLQFFHMHFVASDCDHVLAVLAVAREELADAGVTAGAARDWARWGTVVVYVHRWAAHHRDAMPRRRTG